MKNKEIEELLNKLKTILKTYKELKVEPTLCEELITTGELSLLLSYIEQLENNKEKEYVLVGRMQLKTRDYIHQLEKEKRKLENNRDKAIEYVEKHTDKLKNIIVPKIDFDYKELLNKLKGDSDE